MHNNILDQRFDRTDSGPRIFAHNGSLLAHAYRDEHLIRAARTDSATMSAAFLSYMASQQAQNRSSMTESNSSSKGLVNPNSIVYESPSSNHRSVITPVGPKVLLAVTAKDSSNVADSSGSMQVNDTSAEASSAIGARTSPPSPPSSSLSNEDLSDQDSSQNVSKALLEDIVGISEQVSAVLTEEMRSMTWPEGA